MYVYKSLKLVFRFLSWSVWYE